MLWYANQPLGSEPRFRTVTVTCGNLVRQVTASGQLNPIIKVDVGSQISGNIQKLFVDFNSVVKEGQLLAQIDPGTYEANVLQAQGNLAHARSELKLATINAERAKALRAGSLKPHQIVTRATMAANAQFSLFRPFTNDLTETPFNRFFSFMIVFISIRSRFFSCLRTLRTLWRSPSWTIRQQTKWAPFWRYRRLSDCFVGSEGFPA